MRDPLPLNLTDADVVTLAARTMGVESDHEARKAIEVALEQFQLQHAGHYIGVRSKGRRSRGWNVLMAIAGHAVEQSRALQEAEEDGR